MIDSIYSLVVVFLFGMLCGLLVGMMVADGAIRANNDRALVTRGFAYYTNSTHGYPVLVFKEVKP